MGSVNQIINKLDELDELNELQQYQILLGKESGIDITVYQKKEFSFLQMEQLRIGLEEGLDVSTYLNADYDSILMREIRLAIGESIPVAEYLFPGINGLVLKELRKAMHFGVSLLSYAKQGYDAVQLYYIREALRLGIQIDPYINTEYTGAQIKEITIGLENRVDVSVYATGEYNWMQMQEIRLGLEESLDVSTYAKKLATHKQMREIRLGLEENLDVSVYQSLMFSAGEMALKREALLAEKRRIEEVNQLFDEDMDLFGKAIETLLTTGEDVDLHAILSECSKESKFASVQILDDGMSAMLSLKPPEAGSEYSKEQIISYLKENGVKYGILEQELEQMIKEGVYNKDILVAKGKPCVNGIDGRYHYYFDDLVSNTPREKEDGSVDYRDLHMFHMIEKDQLIAEYIPAKSGVFGFRVDGTVVTPAKGKDLPTIRGRGFYISKERISYYASFTGKVHTKGEYEIEILKVLILENVGPATGNIYFEGDILIKGDIRSGYSVRAAENIEVGGHVEESIIECGGDIVIKQGMHGNYRGRIKAGGNVSGTFFEAAEIEAEGSVTANYILNCKIQSCGKVYISGKKGSIIGGSVYGALGVEAYRIGNDKEITTLISAGVERLLLNRMNRIREQREKIISDTGLLMESRRRLEQIATLSVEKLMLLDKIKDAYESKQTELSQVEEEERLLKVLVTKALYAKVIGKGAIYRGTVVTVQASEVVVHERLAHAYFTNHDNKGIVARRL